MAVFFFFSPVVVDEAVCRQNKLKEAVLLLMDCC